MLKHLILFLLTTVVYTSCGKPTLTSKKMAENSDTPADQVTADAESDAETIVNEADAEAKTDDCQKPGEESANTDPEEETDGEPKNKEDMEDNPADQMEGKGKGKGKKMKLAGDEEAPAEATEAEDCESNNSPEEAEEAEEKNETDDTPKEDTAKVVYGDIATAIDKSCNEGGCHSAPSPADGIPLDTYQDLMDNFDVSIDSIEGGRMPIGMRPDLSTEELALLMQWAKDGFLEK